LLQVQPTQAVAQVDKAQKITVSANGAQEFAANDMAKVRLAAGAGRHWLGWCGVPPGCVRTFKGRFVG